MAELVKWPELEHLDDPLDPEAAPLAPVEIRFEVRPGPEEKWDSELAAECSVAGHPAPSPGAVLSFREWEKDPVPTLYCYALARNLHEGDEVKLRVHPRDKHRREKPEVLWEKEFRVHVEGGKFQLAEPR
jgi:hypothetical protein